jgi:hypothetical protein
VSNRPGAGSSVGDRLQLQAHTPAATCMTVIFNGFGLFIDSVSPVSLADYAWVCACATPVHRVACSDVCEQLHTSRPQT